MGAPRLLAAGFLAWVSAAAAWAQDPVPLFPENYTVLLENERVRVLDFRLRRGARESSHSHPAHVVYVLAPFRIRFTFPDGSHGMREAKAGDVLWSEPVTHASENVGETDAHGILVELKGGAAAARQSLPASAGGIPDGLTAVTFIEGAVGREDELRRELLALAAPTRAEPGSLVYDLYQSPQRRNRFMRFEVWRDAAALEAHKATPHIQASFARRREQGWKTEITLWERVPE
jgi:quinol monooxygenase YgiN/quercetin dioxygenase-like cupin family protein